MLSSKCAVWNTKKWKIIKQQGASGLGSLGIKAPLNKIPLSDPLLF